MSMKLSLPLMSAALVLSACAPVTRAPLPDPASFRVVPSDVVTLEGIGDVGRWMITKELKNATWLGEAFQGKVLREPINVVFIDKGASSASAAAQRLLAAMDAAGYGPKNMHSDGYYGYLNGAVMPQYPQEKGHAFSDGPWYGTNNHGRIFGPFQTAAGYTFLGAFSREDFKLLPKPRHTYNSFQAAREDLATQLSRGGVYHQQGYVNMGSVLDNATETTGDHDGQAVVLVAQ